ncbi:importin alpha [Cyclospora cayetanensis]|uniref:Importin subunit alpha n=1 Tax=Cyclospora cayetanensis TaxID=88456 RepID=A0A1D3DAQ2_9EIME|nr:importin alpha [Cyclospora cayetanensis]
MLPPSQEIVLFHRVLRGGAGAPGGPPELAGKDLQQLMAALASGNPDAELQATQLFRRALSIEHNPPIQLVIDAGAVPHFVRFLSMTGRENLQFEAAWALTNIASGTQEQTKTRARESDDEDKAFLWGDFFSVPFLRLPPPSPCGMTPPIQLLRSPKEEVREQAVWALGNIAGDSPNCRNLVLDANALQPLLEQLNTPDSKLAMLRNATWTLSNFCRGKPAPAFDRVAPALPTLAALIYSDDLEVLTDACWALSYLSDGPNDRIEAVLQAGDDRQTQVVLTCGAVPKLLGLLSSTRKTVQKEACWTISNITAGNRDQIQEVLDSGAIPALLHVLQTAEFDTKKEAAWAISNAVSGGSDAQVEALVRLGCVPPLCELISCVDSKIVMVALEALHAILRTGKKLKETEGLLSNPFADLIEQADGTAALEKLQDSNNEAIFKKEEEGVSTDMGVPGGLGDGSGFGAEAPQGGFKFG